MPHEIARTKIVDDVQPAVAHDEMVSKTTGESPFVKSSGIFRKPYRQVGLSCGRILNEEFYYVLEIPQLVPDSEIGTVPRSLRPISLHIGVSELSFCVSEFVCTLGVRPIFPLFSWIQRFSAHSLQEMEICPGKVRFDFHAKVLKISLPIQRNLERMIQYLISSHLWFTRDIYSLPHSRRYRSRDFQTFSSIINDIRELSEKLHAALLLRQKSLIVRIFPLDKY